MNTWPPTRRWRTIFAFTLVNVLVLSFETASSQLQTNNHRASLSDPILNDTLRLTTKRPLLLDDIDELKDSGSGISTIKVGIGKPVASSTGTVPKDGGDQMASPTVTSVHQVWTASSSGSLDELSPEIISKLRNDVPFLAAYALRPRLVGAQSGLSVPQASSQLVDQLNSKLHSPTRSLSAKSSGALMLQSAASSPKQISESPNLIPKLGDFSEFNVETSSTSKSEHHHKRKTILKRKNDDLGELKKLKKRVQETTNQLIRQNRKNKARASSMSLSGSRDVSKSSPRLRQFRAKKSSSSSKRKLDALKRSQIRSGRLSRKMIRRNLQHHMNIIKHGRYYQAEQSNSPIANSAAGKNNDGKKSVISMRSGTKTTNGEDNDNSDDGNEDDVKGGTHRTANREPFYSKARPVEEPKAPGNEESLQDSTNGLDSDKPIDDQQQGDSNSKQADDGQTDDELDDGQLAAQPQPKRVGDDDVEEDGDTVMVEPKSDGVDDDPEIPSDDEGSMSAGQGPSVEGEQTDNGAKADSNSDGESEKQGDDKEPPTRDVNRGRPNVTKTTDSGRRQTNQGEGGSGDGEGENDSDGNSSAGGGGIGATIGGASSRGSGNGNQMPRDDPTDNRVGNGDEDNENEAEDQATAGRKANRGEKVVPGVVFANDDDDDDDGDREEKRKDGERTTIERDGSLAGKRGEGEETSNENDDDDDGNNEPRYSVTGGNGTSEASGEGEFGSRMNTNSGSRGEAGSAGKADSGSEMGDDDVRRPAKKLPAGASASDEEDADRGDIDYRDDKSTERKETESDDDEASGNEKHRPMTVSTHKHKGGDKHCEDGSYDHHDHHHHDHHNSIKWLQDAIPGDPGTDYPILSRINLTNFNCRDQKYPGFYADVEARCQVFHICQADGRQDSFLCPNGTIFSQTSRVCVWWNSFDCEDAPKYYSLNELLYKTPRPSRRSDGSQPDLKPLDGTRIGVPRREAANDDGGDEVSSIDGLISAMRRSNEATKRQGGVGSDDYDEDDDRAPDSSRRRRIEPESRSATGEDDRDSALAFMATKRKAPAGSMATMTATTMKTKSTAMLDTIGPDDEATIQRKSGNFDGENSARLFAPGGPSRAAINAEPRRNRRASGKPAPPKLKSRRRFAKNSKGYRLRPINRPKRRP